jgi:hypothetical protein
MSALPPKADIRLRNLCVRLCVNRRRMLRCPEGFRRLPPTCAGRRQIWRRASQREPGGLITVLETSCGAPGSIIDALRRNGRQSSMDSSPGP